MTRIENGRGLSTVEAQTEARPERETVIAGWGLVIINAETGEIWMVREKKDKAKAARKSGEWTIPLETMKEGESTEEAIIGAMAEAFDDFDKDGNDIREQLVASLLHVKGNSLHEGLVVPYGNHRFELNYAVLLYDGPAINVQPYNFEEVGNGKWTSPRALLAPETRLFTRFIGEDVLGGGVYDENLTRYRAHPDDRLPVFGEGFSIRAAYSAREQLPDMQ